MDPPGIYKEKRTKEEAKMFADLIIYSNAIFDAVRDEPFEGAVAVAGQRILYVGDRNGVREYVGPQTEVREFGDRLVMPGFFDGHGHFQTTAVREYGTCISHLEDCRSEEECVQGVLDYLKEHPECKRVHGRCFFTTSWGPGAAEPTKKSLDEKVPDIPVYLISSSGHVSWLNTAAIRECRLEEIISAHPEWPAEFARRYDDGELTGFITENLSYTVRYMVEVYAQEEFAKWDEMLARYLTKVGITSFTDTNLSSPKIQINAIEPLKRMENEGRLNFRYHQWCGQNIDGRDENHAAENALDDLKILSTFLNTDRIRIAGEKLMLDGVPDSYTGAMLEPYAGNPETRGELLGDPETYKKIVTKANAMGFSVKIHCLGDRSTRVAIDAYEESFKVNGPDPKRRNAVEHMPIISDEDIERMARYNIIASVQPAHLADWFNGCAEAIYGSERASRDSRYQTLLKAGVKLSIGTDTPVVRIDPLRTVYEAVTRKGWDDGELKCTNPQEALTLSQTLKGYTIGSAYANGFEEKAGSLEIGKYADIVVIDRNLFAVPVEEIKEAENICTIFDGQIIYEKE